MVIIRPNHTIDQASLRNGNQTRTSYSVRLHSLTFRTKFASVPMLNLFNLQKVATGSTFHCGWDSLLPSDLNKEFFSRNSTHHFGDSEYTCLSARCK
jgi:hypothetical protein